MVKSLLLMVCAAFMIAGTITADAPTPPCDPGCAVNLSAH